MIVVDTSALFAILVGEPEAETFIRTIVGSSRAFVGSATAFEFKLVAFKKLGAQSLPSAAEVLAQSPIEIVAWGPPLVDLATEALERFGGRPARLNFGDCMAYALAKSLGAPLLYKGGDFAMTDLRPAL